MRVHVKTYSHSSGPGNRESTRGTGGQVNFQRVSPNDPLPPTAPWLPQFDSLSRKHHFLGNEHLKHEPGGVFQTQTSATSSLLSANFPRPEAPL